MPADTAKNSHYARLRRQHRDQFPYGKQNSSNFASNSCPNGRLWLYGLHTVAAILKNPQRKIHRLFLTKNAQARLNSEFMKNYAEEFMPKALPICWTDPRTLNEMLGSQAVHQGIVVETEPLIHETIASYSDKRLILILDQITDPHNVGAILRSAVAFRADMVITTIRHSPQESGVLAKSASGALEYIDLETVRNLAETLGKLNEAGFLTIGLDSEGSTDLQSSLSGEKIALILGAEHKGLRQKTRQVVQKLAQIPMPGEIRSLNVSNAAAIALYATHTHLHSI